MFEDNFKDKQDQRKEFSDSEMENSEVTFIYSQLGEIVLFESFPQLSSAGTHGRQVTGWQQMGECSPNLEEHQQGKAIRMGRTDDKR